MSDCDGDGKSKTLPTDASPAVVMTTARDLTEARHLAKALVEERLAACVQLVDPIRSVYRWQGEVTEDAEVLLLIKTRHERFAALSARVEQLHSYDTPELVLIEARASAAYTSWLSSATDLGED